MPPEPLDRATTPTLADLTKRAATRRDFLRAAGLGGAALCVPGFLAACGDDTSAAPSAPILSKLAGAVGARGATPTVTLDFSSDFGVLNYAYALEQLEAAFYTQVKTAPPSNMNGHEQNVLRQVWAHEVIHMTFFKTALGSKGIPALTPNFSSINFKDRTSVLDAARTFEDLGVAAYNGAGQFLQSAAYLTIAGKIVSVEARHAAAIRDLLQPESSAFAGRDVISNQGLDRALAPSAVLSAVAPFVQNKITLTNVPGTMA
jgi:hypothetical protein